MTAFLTAQGVSVNLAGRAVLNDVSLALSSGHLVALVGPNGAGKTTLLRALAGLVPSAGAIDVGGDALSQGEGERALTLTDEYARRFARPQLGEEREALAIQALVLAGRYVEARDRAARFEAVSPRSLFRPAVEASLSSIP